MFVYQIIITLILRTSYLLNSGLKAVFCPKDPKKKTKYKRPFSMDYRERGSHAQSVYSRQYTHSTLLRVYLAHGKNKGEIKLIAYFNRLRDYPEGGYSNPVFGSGIHFSQ